MLSNVKIVERNHHKSYDLYIIAVTLPEINTVTNYKLIQENSHIHNVNLTRIDFAREEYLNFTVIINS
jgi:hypothetical protein